MASLGRILSRTFFWSYERGTWQYDIAVAAILLFVLATPRRWFHDEPEVGLPASSGQVQLVGQDATGHETYRVDARVLAPPERTPQLQNDLHNALQKAQEDLHSGRFSIAKIEAERDEHGTVVAYRVEISRK